MSELIKSILVFQDTADKSNGPFCKLYKLHVQHKLPCYETATITCNVCVYAVGQPIVSVIKAMERVCEKPK